MLGSWGKQELSGCVIVGFCCFIFLIGIQRKFHMCLPPVFAVPPGSQLHNGCWVMIMLSLCRTVSFCQVLNIRVRHHCSCLEVQKQVHRSCHMPNNTWLRGGQEKWRVEGFSIAIWRKSMGWTKKTSPVTNFKNKGEEAELNPLHTHKLHTPLSGHHKPGTQPTKNGLGGWSPPLMADN